MTNIEHYNFPAFDEATVALRARGYTVFNPAEADRESGFDAMGLEGHEAAEHGFDLRKALKMDLSWICDHATGIAVLPGWEHSLGANAEVALAKALNIPVMAARDWELTTPVHFETDFPYIQEPLAGAEAGIW
jgi:hypothetical protein